MPGFNPFRYRFPYTNLNDINLDWLIKKVRKLSEDVAALDPERMEEIAQQAEAAVQTAQDALETAEGVSGIAADAETIARAAQTTANNAADSAQAAGTAAAAAQTTANNAADSAQAVETALKTYVRPNLLDNWYFVGGGSQQGGGKFPINQRGQISYSNAEYSIDRWYSTGALSLNQTGTKSLTIMDSIFQRYENIDTIIGVPLTFTALTDSGTLYSGTTTMSSSETDATFYDGSGITLVYNSYWHGFQIVAQNKSFKAAKLELGPEQTLAHQKNGAWVLNEIPDYGQELAECQRYYQVRTGWHYLCKSGSADNQNVTWDLPVEMRATPTITITNGNNIEEISFGATKGSVMFYKNGDVKTSLGVYRFTATADL